MPRDTEETVGADAGGPLADLADLILNVGRLVRARTPEGPQVVTLTETERQVMRVVDLYPGAAPSEIARRTRLQRTNVSTALRSLEGKGMVSRAATDGHLGTGTRRHPGRRPGHGPAVHPLARPAGTAAHRRRPGRSMTTLVSQTGVRAAAG